MTTGGGFDQGPGAPGQGAPGAGFPPPGQPPGALGGAPVGTQTADLLRRIGGGVIDGIVLFVVFVLFAAIFGTSDVGDSGFSFSLSGIGFVLYVLVSFGYFFGLEAATAKTLGKMAMGTRVVDATTFGPASTGQIAIRTVLRIVDGICANLVAVIAVAATGEKRQRVGDMAAKTYVVRG